MNTAGNLTHAIAGYRLIEELYRGSRTLVYRAIREADQHPVVIKLLHRDYPSFSELLQFRNQYTIAKNLPLPGIVAPYTLEFYRNSYALVMEDFGGVSLRQYAQKQDVTQQAARLTLTEVLQIALQLADILDGLYRHRVIHKDIKPANILIHPETKQIKLIDFSIASLLPRETQEIQNPNVLEGTLAYISPEQTGRMNRGIDYRTDFYSLGVTLYELLTGQLPFECEDPMELVHCHIAKIPTALGNREEIPPVISDLVMKLMAKNAEDRYQSALGLKHDLERCWQQFQENGYIESFELGQRDVCDRFLIPEKLYGRETEVQTLLNAFDRVANGTSELMLVAGFSGIGKTAVVNEVHKPIVRQRGYFIKGKFDQFSRNTPFSAFVQAFRDLMAQLLSESDAEIQTWKTKILQAVGDSGQVIIEVIPELERIIEKQPPAPELSGIAAQNLFNLLFQKFISVFTTKEHPLVIFLDDLQWVDSASLKLMQLLVNESKLGYLLLLGAYRDNEVSPSHPLILTLDEIRKAGTTLSTITLAPLSQISLNQLIADTLVCFPNFAQPLTELVYQKTQGNPFFATQFLKALHQDKLINFDIKAGYWQCDISKVKAAAITDNVVEFMVQQLQKLPTETQSVLKLAACIGNQFDLTTLAIVLENSETETATALWKALQEGLVLPQSEVYKFYVGIEQNISQPIAQKVAYRFLHDRVQQAAYSLIPEDKKQATHLQIGQLLLQNSSDIEQDEKIFDIVRHLNQGKDLIAQPSDRQELAKLNLLTGRKAKNSNAYAAATTYLQMAMGLLNADCWKNQYELTLNIYIATAEAEYLNLNFEESLKLAELALNAANTLLEKVKVYELQMQICIAQQIQMVAAVDIGLEVLEKLQISMLTIDLGKELIIELPNVDDLDNLPPMTDPYKLAAMEILRTLCTPVFATRPEIFPQLIITMINLCIQYGNSAISSFAYGFYGLLLVGFDQLDRGYHAGLIALKLLDKFNAKELKAKVYNLFNANIRTWKEHPKNSVYSLREGIQAGLEVGDLEWGGYCSANLCSYLFFTEDNLESATQQQEVYVNLCVSVKQESSSNFAQVWRQLGLNLRGKAADPLLLSGTSFDEEINLPRIIAAKSGIVLFMFYLAKTILCYLLGDRSQALKNVGIAQEQSASAFGFMQVVVLNFYHSLTLLESYGEVTVDEQSNYLEQVNVNQEKMKFWAESAPAVNQHRYELIEAEKARILGSNWQALELYDRAIALAKENQFIQDEALANELAAKFYLYCGKEKIAASYMQEAYYCYARWGAKAKIEDIERRYPQLLQPILNQPKLRFNPLETLGTISQSSQSSSTSISDALDFASIVQAAQALSSKIQLDELFATLNQIILKTSGAETCVLLLPHQDEWQIRAITQINPDHELPTTLLQTQPLDGSTVIPLKLFYYVKHTLKTVVIEGGKTDIPGLMNDGTLQYQSQSMLCTPILDRGNLVAILYLEHRSTKGVFTSDRLLVINFLCTQAAISLENAILYQQAQDYAHQLEQSQLQLVQSEKMSALGNLVAGVAHEINNPVGFISGNINEAIAAVKDITEYLQLCQEKFPHPGDEIEEKAAEIDIEYLIEDLPKMLNSMQVGCDRIQGISTSLRTFSRADKDYKVPFHIHDGIDSTILILKHRLKGNDTRPAIEVVKEYGNLPPIECFPGQLNQVFMNILANAIDALEEASQGRSLAEIKAHPNRITIRTEMAEREWIKIQLADNGNGITEEVKHRIFDHLFTTKGVGKGTGLGLAIARQIVVEKHGGTIQVNSAPGQGTEFAITLPVKG